MAGFVFCCRKDSIPADPTVWFTKNPGNNIMGFGAGKGIKLVRKK